ncbi:MAG: hypothetical protein U0325_31605 [Polyangiales bacterium]
MRSTRAPAAAMGPTAANTATNTKPATPITTRAASSSWPRGRKDGVRGHRDEGAHDVERYC